MEEMKSRWLQHCSSTASPALSCRQTLPWIGWRSQQQPAIFGNKKNSGKKVTGNFEPTLDKVIALTFFSSTCQECINGPSRWAKSCWFTEGWPSKLFTTVRLGRCGQVMDRFSDRSRDSVLSKFERIYKRLHRLRVKTPRSQSRRRRSARPKHRKRFLQRPVDDESHRSAQGVVAGSGCPVVFYNHEVSGYRRLQQLTCP